MFTKLIAEFEVVGATDVFVVSEHFKLNKDEDAPVKIAYLNDTFKKLFSDVLEGKAQTKKLTCKELCGYAKPEIFVGQDLPYATLLLQHVWTLIKEQGHGEDGHLPTNGTPSILFVVSQKTKKIWVVCFSWHSAKADGPHGEGWIIKAYPLKEDKGWDKGTFVFLG